MSSELTGSGALVRAIVRRDRLRVALWVGGIVAMTVSSAAGVQGIYPTTDDLRRAAVLIEGNAAAIAFNGPAQGLDTLGGRIAFETGAFTLLLVGLMSVFMLSRQTRAEEEAGRLELVRATVVGRRAPLAAALVVVAAMNAAVGALIIAGFLGLGLPAAGSVAFGLSALAVGLVFAGITAATAQVAENTRVATGLAGVTIGVAYVVRAVGDIGGGTLSWLSPIGWGQKTRPFAGEQWWPLVVPAAAALGCLWLAAVLLSRRDLGGGLFPTRPGRGEAGPRLGTPLGLTVRLQRGALVGWATGIFVLGAIYGSVAQDIDDFFEDMDEQIRELIARSGGNLVDSFLGTTLLILALTGTGFALQSVLRLRSEETALHAEPVLAAPVSRWRWAASHFAVTMGGAALVLAAGGLGLGLAYGLTIGDLAQVPRRIGDAAAYLPAVAVTASVGLALFGLVPRTAPAVWGLLVLSFVGGFFGELLDLPAWILRLSPYEHVPLGPAEPFTAGPLLILTALALALGAAGLWGFRTRDVG